MSSKIFFFKLQPHLGANELRMAYVFQNKLPPPITLYHSLYTWQSHAYLSSLVQGKQGVVY